MQVRFCDHVTLHVLIHWALSSSFHLSVVKSCSVDSHLNWTSWTYHGDLTGKHRYLCDPENSWTYPSSSGALLLLGRGSMSAMAPTKVAAEEKTLVIQTRCRNTSTFSEPQLISDSDSKHTTLASFGHSSFLSLWRFKLYKIICFICPWSCVFVFPSLSKFSGLPVFADFSTMDRSANADCEMDL